LTAVENFLNFWAAKPIVLQADKISQKFVEFLEHSNTQCLVHHNQRLW